MKKLNPAYGLPDYFRQKVLDTAAVLGVAAAAQLHGVSTTSVYNWRRWLEASNSGAAQPSVGDK